LAEPTPPELDCESPSNFLAAAQLTSIKIGVRRVGSDTLVPKTTAEPFSFLCFIEHPSQIAKDRHRHQRAKRGAEAGDHARGSAIPL